MSPRSLTSFVIALAVGALVLVGAPLPSHAGSRLSAAPERGTTLAAVVHVESGVVARAARHPTPSGSCAEARNVMTLVAATSGIEPFASAVGARAPLYVLFRVYRL